MEGKKNKLLFRKKKSKNKIKCPFGVCHSASREFVATNSTLKFVETNYFYCRDKLFFSPTFRDYNFFVLTRILACDVSLEISLNVE